MKFTEFKLKPEVQKALANIGYVDLTEIQEKAIPMLLEHEGDFVGQAQTGTGKTAAFLLPLLEKIDFNEKKIQAFILSPTRELANQIENEIIKFAEFLPIRTVCVYGGTSYDKQIRTIRKDMPQIVVGTPGRTLDLIDKGILKLDEVKFAIIDEADEMLNMGFLEDVNEILSKFKDNRSVWMFSATMPKQVLDIVQRNFNDTKYVKVESKIKSNSSIAQYYCVLKPRNYIMALQRVVQANLDMYGIVFCQTKRNTEEVTQALLDEGVSVVSLHGDLSQGQRDEAMARFKAKKAKLLVCTDVAARGIDIQDITHVFNFSMPNNFESYIHRIGRTGRAGSVGVSLTFVAPAEAYKISQLEKFINQKIEKFTLPTALDAKKNQISYELEKVTELKERVQVKGDEFRLDEAFTHFNAFVDDLSKDELKKLFFSWKFNNLLKRIDSIGNIEAEKLSMQPASYGRSSGGGNRRGGNDRGGRSSGGYSRGGSRDGGNYRQGGNAEAANAKPWSSRNASRS